MEAYLSSLCQTLERHCPYVWARVLQDVGAGHAPAPLSAAEIVPRHRSFSHLPYPLFRHSLVLLLRHPAVETSDPAHLELHQLRLGREIVRSVSLDVDDDLAGRLCQWVEQVFGRGQEKEELRLCPGVVTDEEEDGLWVDVIGGRSVRRAAHCAILLTQETAAGGETRCRQCQRPTAMGMEPGVDYVVHERLEGDGEDEDEPSAGGSRDRQPETDGFCCHICGQSYSSRSSLNKHERRHRKNEVDESSLCRPQRRPVRLVEATIEEYEDDEEEEEQEEKQDSHRPCQLCGKMMKKASIASHLRLVHGGASGDDNVKRRHVCDVCGKAYKSKSGLVKHSYMHSEERPYCCVYCGKTYRDNDLWNNCQRRCSGNFRYQCGHCDKRFNRKFRFVAHQRVHTGEKPFQCALCPYKCNRKDNLQLHERKKHGKEAPVSAEDSLRVKTPRR